MLSWSNTLSLLVLSLASWWLPAAEDAQPAHAARVVLVAPFENQTSVKCMVSYEVATSANPNDPRRTFSVDRYSEAPRAILENELTNVPGVTVAERQRVDAMLLENSLGAFSGLTDGAAAANLGRMAGAQVIIMGTILRIDAEERAFSGYGVQTMNSIVTAQIRIRSVDVATGAIIASTIVEGQKSYAKNQFGGIMDSDVAYAVLSVALKRINSDHRFMASLTGTAKNDAGGTSTAVKIAPDPSGCDVLVDGIFRGTSPVTLTLPSAAPARVRLEKTGYIPWERTLVPAQTQSVEPELGRQP